MTKPNICILDISTGEEIIREMNDEEYAQYLADKSAYEAEQAAKQVTE